PQLFALAPIRAARFPDASNEVTALTKSPYLARLRSLDINYMCVCGRCPIERELRKLFASPHVANLNELMLSANRIDAELARRLATSRHLTQLIALDLSHNPLGTEGVRALAESPHLRDLRTLNLANMGRGLGPLA